MRPAAPWTGILFASHFAADKSLLGNQIKGGNRLFGLLW
jgi:hypothetical protein